ncbi:MAG: C13 family peptidase [Desulfamplus sp.]
MKSIKLISVLLIISILPTLARAVITPDNEIPQTQIVKAPVEDTTKSEREASSKPNLTPYKPSGWSDKIVVSNSTGTNTDMDVIYITDEIYINFAFINDSDVNISSKFNIALYVDEKLVESWTYVRIVESNYYVSLKDYNIGVLNEGEHTIKLVVDSTGLLDESDETDNTYIKYITVSSGEKPNLKPYKPPGWSDKIVVSNKDSVIDIHKIFAGEDLYLKFVVLNDSPTDITSKFDINFYIGEETGTFTLSRGIEAYTWYASGFEITDYVSLSPGKHTIKMVIDATGVIRESDETDNEYIKTITVEPFKLESVYPSIGKIDDDLEVNLEGIGFDTDTRVSISADTGNASSIIGYVDTPGVAYGITVVNGKAYIASGKGGLQVVDITQADNPVIIGSVDTPDGQFNPLLPDGAMNITIVGNKAYLANGSSGLFIIDITNPYEPAILGSVDTPGRAWGVAVQDGIAYVADHDSGLQIIDVTNPAQPFIIRAFNNLSGSNVCGIAVANGKAYVGGGYLDVIDITNPTEPFIVGSVKTEGNITTSAPYGIRVLNGKVYVADSSLVSGYSGLSIIDVTNPAQPFICGNVDTPGRAQAVTVYDEKAYVVNGGSGLQVIDIKNPEQPVIIAGVSIPGSAYSVAVVDQKAYVASGNGGLQIVDVSNPVKPQIVGDKDTPGYTERLFVSEGIAYLANGVSGLQIIDIKDKKNPFILGTVDTDGYTTGVTVVNKKVYISDGDAGLKVIDISNPSIPIILGTVDTLGFAFDVAVLDKKAYVVNGGYSGHKGLQVIDIADPAKPVIVGSLEMSGATRSLTVLDGNVYITDGLGLNIIDVTNPAKPVIIGSVDTDGYTTDVTVLNNKAYVANGSYGLSIIDISNPAQPVIIGAVKTPYYHIDNSSFELITSGLLIRSGDGGSALGITIHEGKAYIANGTLGVQVIDITNPSKPVVIGSVDTPGGCRDMVIIEDHAYIADGDFGLVIVPLPVEIYPTLINSNTLSATISSLQLAGQYNVRVINKYGESNELKGAVSFFEPAEYWNLAQKKAIIVAGRSAADNVLWNSTKTCTNMAYRALLTQGYTRNTIQYLSPEKLDADHDGALNDVDEDATLSTLEYAINNWAADTNELLLYMTDHGGDGTFRINPSEIVTAQELDKQLDAFQNRTHARVILVYDACLSGSFIEYLQPPNNEERIIITSTKPNESSYFNGPEGQISFSYQFWSSVMLNGNLNAAFSAGSNIVTGHTPQLDGNGDGVTNQAADHSEALDITICRGRSVKREPPRIGGVCPDKTLDGNTLSAIWVDNVTFTNKLDRIFAIIEPPGVDALPADIPITDLPSVELSAIKDSNGNPTGKYEALYNDFTLKGTYKIAVYAVDKEEIYSNPARTNIIQNIGETSLLVLAAPKGGIYSKTQNVQFNFSPEDASIYYTLDGSNPDPSITQASNKYTESNPITISEDTILKFIAIDSEGSKSPVYTEDYTIDTIAPLSPNINLPENENSKIITNPYPTFYWKAPKDADYSILQYSKYSDFSDYEEVSYLRGASGESSLLYTVSTPLPEYGKWYWRIQSIDKAGNKSLWSSSELEFQEDTAVHKAVILSTGDIDENTSIDPNTEEGYSNEDFKTAMETIISHAYKALIWQNYDKSNIYLLSPDSAFDADKDGASDVSARLTKNDFESAVKDWASDADDLIIFMVGQGENGIFHLNSSETLTAQELKSWLDDLQSASDVKVRIVYDASDSGSFIPYLASQQNKERITIASASVQNAGSRSKSSANFFNNGEISFSYPFWSNIRDTSKLYSSYRYGRSMMEPHLQKATYDADSDGTAYDNDDDDLNIISGIQIGYGRKAASSPPVIGSVCASQVVAQNQISNQTFSIKDIWVSGISSLNPISQVLAVISKVYDSQNDDSQTSGDIKSKAEILLQDIDGDKKYEGSYSDQVTHSLFDSEGVYTIAVYAKDSQGYYSLPVTTTITVVKDGDDSNYAVLTENSPAITVAEGVHVKVIGSAGANIVNVGSGAKVECINFPGQNQIIIDEASSNFTVKRSGAVVILQNQASGTMVKIPASAANQTIKFTTDDKSFTLVISNSSAAGAKVMFGSWEVGLSENQL